MAKFNGTSANMASIGTSGAAGATGTVTTAQISQIAQHFNNTTYLPTQIGLAGQYYISNGAGNVSAAWSQPSYNTIPLAVSDGKGNEIVRLETDGTVVWSKGIDVDAATEAFSKSLRFGAELVAGITYGAKQRMRDVVFEEIISMAQEKGSITAEELTYLHKAAKIIDKLKGKV